MENFQISLAAARVNAKMTQDDVAKAMHVSKQTIVNWETGKIIPRFAQLGMLCQLYSIPSDYIFLPEQSTLSGLPKTEEDSGE